MNSKDILYYMDENIKACTLIKSIIIYMEIAIFLCKEEKEMHELINNYVDLLYFIIIISIRIMPENISNKKLQLQTRTKLNDKEISQINQDLIFFSIKFLFYSLSTNIIILKSNELKA